MSAMKSFTNYGILCQLLIIAIVITGCVSTTVFRTNPTHADVYVKGEKKGRTPYYYSDRKIVASSTPVSFRKQGYNDLNIILRRDEKLDVGPFIGGLFILVPFLWVTEYDSLHSYQLERDSSYLQLSATIPVPADSSINGNNDNLAKHDSIGGIAEVANEASNEPEQGVSVANDSLQNGKDNSGQKPQIKNSPTYFGFGGGFCIPGSLWGVHYTFVSLSGWGGSVAINSNIFKSDDVPADYYDDGNRVFAPKDYINSFTFNIVKEFNSPRESRRYGLEFGPSWVIYREAQFKLNPDYDESGIFGIYKYQKSHSRENVFGLSIRAKMEFLFSNSSGLELAAFTNINGIKSIVGFEADLILGRMGHVK
jgi:hypothetical protein